MTGITTARGYGARHQALRRQLLDRWKPGDPCTWCGQPMWSRWTFTRNGTKVSAIDLGHTTDRTAYAGLQHRACNRGEAAARGNRRRGWRKRWRPQPPPRRW